MSFGIFLIGIACGMLLDMLLIWLLDQCVKRARR